MSGEPSVSNLFPAIAQSFAIILLGYLFGHFKIIPPGEARAISELVGKLALPALLFQNLATLDLSTINWRFMSGILIAKFFVFLVTVVLTLIVSRPINIGKAGLFGIFTTQSNDFALGLPIVQALYGRVSGEGNFNYTSYIYLLAPISLVIINPMGFFMMEYWKQSNKKRITLRYLPTLLLNTLKGVVLNPIIFMTALGIVYNVVVHYGIFHGREDSQRNIPHWFGGFLTTLADAYAACALLQIGIFMVGKIKKTTGILVMVSGLLIFAKTVLLPIVADRVLYLILPADSGNSTVSRSSISTFGFLYGTFPTAPTVFVFSNQYTLAMDIVASSIVLCTFMSAPIMYISARLVLISKASDAQYNDVIQNTRRDVTIVALISLAWVYLLFICARRYRSYLHIMIMHYMAALVLEAVGGELLAAFTKNNQIYWQIFAFSLFFPGVLASRLWTAWLAIGLILVLYKGERVAEKFWIPLMLSAWGIPILVTVIMVIICTVDPSNLHEATVDITFLFGNSQLVVSAIVLVFSFLVGFIFLVASALKMGKERNVPSNESDQQRVQPNNYGSMDNSLQSAETESSTEVAGVQGTSIQRLRRAGTSMGTGNEPETSKHEHKPLLQQNSKYEASQLRFVLLLLFLLFSCLVGILIVFWKLVNKEITGIFIGINVLDTTTNFGQGFFVFIVFGFEKHWFWTALYKRLRKFLFKIENVYLPLETELSSTTRALCLDFKEHYLAECRSAIESDKRYLTRVYQGVFIGSDLVDWMLERGVVRTREDATHYGHTLLLGRVLTHVTNEHYFYDDKYFYRFTE